MQVAVEPESSSPYSGVLYPQPPSSPPSSHWQQQLQMAQLSRQTNSPHSYARSAAVASRSSGGQNQVPLTVTELAMQIVQQHHRQTQPYRGPNRGAAIMQNPQQKNEQLEEERQRRINEDINKQFWTALDLSGQGICHVTPKLFNYNFLQKLYLNHNKLMVVPSSITKLTQLKVLDLSDNMLNELPPELGQLFSLRYLFVFDNKIQSLPYEFGSLFQLEVLGVEGNPINEQTREILAKEGTRGVIIDLRERAPVTVVSPPREWLLFDDPKVEQEEPDSFSVLSYNTLCDLYASPQMYAYTPSWALGWKYRSELLKEEILSFDTDIVCFQEADAFNFESYFTPQLAAHGYQGVYWPKTRARTMSEPDSKKVDGCATFYKSAKLNLVDRYCIEYNSLALRKDDLKKTADIYNRVMNKDNIALITIFEYIPSGQLFMVANTHLHWDPAFKDVKLVQVALLLEELERVVDKYASNNTQEGSKYPKYTDRKNIPLVICGDFNSSVDSGVYQLFSQGKIGAGHPDLEGRVYGRFTDEGMGHRFTLKSAYNEVGELPFTNYTPNFVEVIDYIWYSTPSLSVTRLLGQIDPKYTKHFVGFPNAHHPSDHIPLAAQFSFKKQKEPLPKPAAPNFGTSRKT
jgi:CCR4-NOT transcription complex subunit 6